MGFVVSPHYQVQLMNDANTPNLRQGDDGAYDAMAKAAQASVGQLLTPFKAAANADALLKTMSSEDFFKKFLVYADQFSDVCCQEYAKIMRQCTLMPEIRGTPTLTLAKDIRKDVFEPLDGILVSYVEALKQVGIDLGAVSTQLHNSSVTDAALKGAAVGQVAGGFGDSGKTLGGLNALMQAGAEAERKLALLQQRAELLKQAETMTLPKIVEYLKAVMKLPERLLDFGCAKCFGGQVSLERQQKATEEVMAAITPQLEAAMSLIQGLPEAEKRFEDQRIVAAKAQELAKKHGQEMEFRKRDPGVGIFLIALSIGLAAWAYYGCDLDTSSQVGIVWGLLLYVVAVWALVFGIMKFFDRRPKDIRRVQAANHADNAGAHER